MLAEPSAEEIGLGDVAGCDHIGRHRVRGYLRGQAGVPGSQRRFRGAVGGRGVLGTDGADVDDGTARTQLVEHGCGGEHGAEQIGIQGSPNIARAEQTGLVERSPSSASRRAVCVRLTEAGHRLIETTVRQLLAHEADLISALTAAERAALTGFLAKLEQALVTSPHDELRK